MYYDFTALSRLPQGQKQRWPALQFEKWATTGAFDAVRGKHGMWVIVFPTPAGAAGSLSRHHVLLAESSVQGAGVGLFTVSGVLSGAAAPDPLQHRPPQLCTSAVGQYTGAVQPKVRPPVLPRLPIAFYINQPMRRVLAGAGGGAERHHGA